MADYQLEIHHIDVTGGDCTLIVVKNLSKENNPVVSSVLVDVGGVGSGPRKMLNYLTEFFPKIGPIDLFIASHYHDDHIRGLSYLTKEAKKVAFKRVLDIGYTDKICHPSGVSTFDGGAPRSPGYIKVYNEFSGMYLDSRRILPGFLDPSNYDNDGKPKEGKEEKLKPLDIPLVDGESGTGYKIVIWCGKGVLADGTNVLGEQGKHTKNKIDANDLSIGFTVHGPGGFIYFSAGDLSGDTTLRAYRNMEGALIEYMKKVMQKNFPSKIDVVKATHHGSQYNNHELDDDIVGDSKTNVAPGFFETLKPEVVVVPCNQAKQVPAVEFLDDRLLAHLDGDKKRKAFFLNKVSYRKGALAASFKELVNRGEKTTNIRLVDPYYTITQTASIVVVHQASKKFKTPFADECDELSDHDVYKIYRSNKDVGFANAVSQTKGNAVRTPISSIVQSTIFDGFSLQADEIIKWFRYGIKNNKQHEAESYVADLFPTLLTADQFPQSENDLTIEFKDGLALKMETLFGTMFEFYKEKGYWGIKSTGYTDSDEDTMTGLLVGNPFQLWYNFYGQDLSLKGYLDNLSLKTPFAESEVEAKERIAGISGDIQRIFKPNKTFKNKNSTLDKVAKQVSSFYKNE